MKLTMTEAKVLDLLCQGMDPAEIAESIIVSPRTVNWHIGNMLYKCGCKSTLKMVVKELRARAGAN